MRLIESMANNFDRQQADLIDAETRSRADLQKPKAQKLIYRNGQPFNLSVRGELQPTKLITNRQIPAGSVVARKSRGSTDAVPTAFTSTGSGRTIRKGQKSILSPQSRTNRSRAYVLKFDIEFVRFFYDIGNTGGRISDSDSEEILQQGAELIVTKEPQGMTDFFSFNIPLSSGEVNFTRGDYLDPKYSYTKAGYSGAYLPNIGQTPWAGARMVSEAQPIDPTGDPLDFETRIAGKTDINGNLLADTLWSNWGLFQNRGIDENLIPDPNGVIPTQEFDFVDIKILGKKTNNITKEEFEMPEYKVKRISELEPYQRILDGMRVKYAEIVPLGL